ncbi:hypothetical protein CUMW_204070 [Citrus unshiu]|uniref:Uncharacterized protein n=1 Tax=Citrus unshiu TaxID=55188 RepID=A0A2H5Q7T5_CITUN|nr:hypothetical protein CUMW_204070 [Citrus unshiu]
MNNLTTMPYYHYFPFVGDMAEKEEPTFDPDLEGRPRRNLTKKKTCREELVTTLRLCTIPTEFQLAKREMI